MTPEQIAGLIRHLGTFFGGYVIAKWGIQPEYFDSILGGLATLGALVWSILAKREAASLPPPAPPAPPASPADPKP